MVSYWRNLLRYEGQPQWRSKRRTNALLDDIRSTTTSILCCLLFEQLWHFGHIANFPIPHGRGHNRLSESLWRSCVCPFSYECRMGADVGVQAIPEPISTICSQKPWYYTRWYSKASPHINVEDERSVIPSRCSNSRTRFLLVVFWSMEIAGLRDHQWHPHPGFSMLLKNWRA